MIKVWAILHPAQAVLIIYQDEDRARERQQLIAEWYPNDPEPPMAQITVPKELTGMTYETTL